MPRNYDEIRDAQDLSFVIRGQTFQLRRGTPEVLDQIETLQRDYLAAEVTTYADIATFSENRLKLLLVEEDAARWDALRANGDDPIAFREIQDLSKWAIEEITGFPTIPSSPSPAGDGTTDTSSKDE